jgi:uncharacterized YigZ family protein
MQQNILQLGSEAKYIIKGSIFISFSAPISNISDFKVKHEELKNKYKDANNICYAYRVKIDNRLDEFSSDDGEPKGSSGQPILNTLKRERLINSAIYVIRYFGGNKLGISGLINAYGTVAKYAIENSIIEPWVLKKEMSIIYQYEIQNKVEHIFKEFGIIIINSKFGSDIKIKLEVENSKIDMFIKKLVNISNGSIKYT